MWLTDRALAQQWQGLGSIPSTANNSFMLLVYQPSWTPTRSLTMGNPAVSETEASEGGKIVKGTQQALRSA